MQVNFKNASKAIPNKGKDNEQRESMPMQLKFTLEEVAGMFFQPSGWPSCQQLLLRN